MLTSFTTSEGNMSLSVMCIFLKGLLLTAFINESAFDNKSAESIFQASRAAAE